MYWLSRKGENPAVRSTANGVIVRVCVSQQLLCGCKLCCHILSNALVVCAWKHIIGPSDVMGAQICTGVLKVFRKHASVGHPVVLPARNLPASLKRAVDAS